MVLGMTYLAIALGYLATRKGYKTRFFLAPISCWKPPCNPAVTAWSCIVGSTATSC